MAHERALQSIANANGGTRASGTPGFDASVAYVSQRLKKAGYKVKQQTFDFPFFQDLADPTLSQVSPTAAEGLRDRRPTSTRAAATSRRRCSRSTSWCRSGTARPSTSTSGCEAADFDGFTAGNVALMQRGTCDFAVKAHNAEDAGRVRGDHLQRGPARPHRPARRHAQRRRPRHPGARPQLRRRRRARRVRAHAGDDGARVRLDAETRSARPRTSSPTRKQGDAGPHARRRRAPRLRGRGPGHQRRRQRHGDGPRDRRDAGQGQDQAAQPRALRVLGRRGVGPGRLDPLRRAASTPRQVGPAVRQPELRHARVAELRAVRVRR